MRLLDVNGANQSLVARQLFRPIEGPGFHRQVFQLHPNAYTFAPGHVPKLQIMSNDAQTPGGLLDLLLGSRGYGRTSPGQEPIQIKNLELRLPTLEEPGDLSGLVKEPAEKVLPPGYELASDFWGDSSPRSAPPRRQAARRSRSTFDASATVADGSPVDEYRWDYDGDDVIDETTTSPTVAHTYPAPGIFKPRLTVENEDGVERSTYRGEQTITVQGAIVNLTAKPAAVTNQTTAAFEFASNEPGSTFECMLDGGAWQSCESGVSYPGLGEGAHSIKVRALIGAEPGLPASYSWQIDLTNPNSSFTAGPPAAVNSQTSADIAFVSNEPGSTFECRYDSSEEADFAACTSPQSVQWDLVEATHTFDVRATDPAGNTGPVATRTWKVDLTAPTTQITGLPKNTLTNTDATVSNPTNVNPTTTTANANARFTLESNEPGTFVCKFNDLAERACQTPIEIGTGTGGTPSQARLGTQIQGTNKVTVWAVDAAGNRDSSGTSYEYRFDNVAPQVELPSGFLPAPRTQQTSFNAVAIANEPIATTSANVPGAGFECSLDSTTAAGFTAGAPFCARLSSTLASHARTGVSANAVHRIRVRATDLAGNVSATATDANATTETARTTQGTYQYTVDTTAPVVSINSGPPTDSVTNSPDASFAFTGTDAFPTGENATITFQCKLDGGSFAPCTSPKSYSGLLNGSHTFTVRPVDQAGNTGTEATRTWTIGAASVNITSKPPAFSKTGINGNASGGTAAFEFVSNGGPGTFECRRKAGGPFTDGTGWSACTTPRDYSGLAQGTQQFEVRADAGGGPGFPAVYEWFVDTINPTATIAASGPAAVTNLATSSTTLSFSASRSGNGLGRRCHRVPLLQLQRPGTRRRGSLVELRHEQGPRVERERGQRHSHLPGPQS